VAGYVMARLRLVLLPVVVAAFLASVLGPPARWLTRHRVAPALATILVFVAGLGTLALVVWLVAPRVVTQAPQVGHALAHSVAQLQQWLTAGPLHLSQQQVAAAIQGAQRTLTSHRQQLITGALSGAALLVQVVAASVLTAFLTFFFVKDGDRIAQWAAGFFRGRRAEHARHIGALSWSVLSGYVRGTTVNGVVEAVLIAATLAILRVPLVAPLAILQFFGAYFPLVGGLVSGAAAALVTLAVKGPLAALVVVAAIIVINQLEAHVLAPFVLGRALRLHPVVVILALAAGAELAGITGAFVAVPIAGVGAAVGGYLRRAGSSPWPGETGPDAGFIAQKRPAAWEGSRPAPGPTAAGSSAGSAGS
jgi:predicted PurR-regulated permease PerM